MHTAFPLKAVNICQSGTTDPQSRFHPSSVVCCTGVFRVVVTSSPGHAAGFDLFKTVIFTTFLVRECLYVTQTRRFCFFVCTVWLLWWLKWLMRCKKTTLLVLLAKERADYGCTTNNRFHVIIIFTGCLFLKSSFLWDDGYSGEDSRDWARNRSNSEKQR